MLHTVSVLPSRYSAPVPLMLAKMVGSSCPVSREQLSRTLHVQRKLHCHQINNASARSVTSQHFKQHANCTLVTVLSEMEINFFSGQPLLHETIKRTLENKNKSSGHLTPAHESQHEMFPGDQPLTWSPCRRWWRSQELLCVGHKAEKQHGG